MRTPEEPGEFDDDIENPADAEGFIAPEYQDSEPLKVTNAFTITEVPIPTSTRTRTLTYPIGTLKAGSNESFYVPVENIVSFKSTAASIRTFGYRNGFKVIIREEGLGIRVWRKA